MIDHTPLDAAFDSPAVKRRYNRHLFATIATRYDLITRLLSYGQDQRWKRRLATLAGITPGVIALDLACGTGDLAALLAARGARVAGLDLTREMIDLARQRATARPVGWMVGDMMQLPCLTASVEVVTAGYGLRNMPALEPALDEIARVLKPGGRFLALDFDRPAVAALRRAYLAYLWGVGSAVGWALHGDADTYRYIPASLQRYPGARTVADLLRARGFARVDVIPQLGGLMAIHVATRA